MKRKPRINQIIKQVSEYYDVGFRHINDKNRKHNKTIIKPRFMIYYICRKIIGYSVTHICKILNRNRSTVERGIKTFESWLQSDNILSLQLTQVKFRIDMFA